MKFGINKFVLIFSIGIHFIFIPLFCLDMI